MVLAVFFRGRLVHCYILNCSYNTFIALEVLLSIHLDQLLLLLVLHVPVPDPPLLSPMVPAYTTRSGGTDWTSLMYLDGRDLRLTV